MDNDRELSTLNTDSDYFTLYIVTRRNTSTYIIYDSNTGNWHVAEVIESSCNIDGITYKTTFTTFAAADDYNKRCNLECSIVGTKDGEVVFSWDGN